MPPVLDQLTPTQRNLLDRALTEGRYQLILGAGASVGATNRQGDSPPLAGELARNLCADFKLPEDDDLSAVYEMAKGEGLAVGTTITSYLRTAYWDCKAPTWYEHLVSIPWSYVWTLNIDDVVEDAYQNTFKARAIQGLISVSWVDKHRVSSAGDLILVHLHGKANTSDPEGLVFSKPEYIRATRDRERWHLIFADRYSDTPSIVIGARLRDEVDLQDVIAAGRADVSDAPSFFVSPTISAFEQRRLKALGLVPVVASGEQFMTELHNAYQAHAPTVDRAADEAPNLINSKAAIFMRQWIQVEPTSLKPGQLDEFFDGHEPQLAQISASLASTRSLQEAVSSEAIGGASPRITVIVGPPFFGKTVILLEVVREALKNNWKVYRFEPDRRPDIAAALWWLRHFSHCLLVINDIDFHHDFARLLESATAEGLACRIVATSRSSQDRDLDRHFGGMPSFTRRDVERLDDREIKALIETLSGNNRLGVLTNRTEAERRRYFAVDHRRELFSALSAIEGGLGFTERAQRAYRELASDGARLLFVLVSIPGANGLGLPLSTAADALGLTPRGLTNLLSDDVLASDLLYIRRGKLFVQQRRVSSLVLENTVNRPTKYDVTRKLAETLAKDLSQASITQSTLQYRIVRQVMDHEVLERWVGQDKVQEWYEEVKDLYDWNARFWEQRALSASKFGEYARAVSWAQVALKRHDDPYTRNTMAVVLLRRALAEQAPELGLMENYSEALDHLVDARRRSSNDSEYPYYTFFSYSLTWATRSVKSLRQIPPLMTSSWVDWQIWAGRVPYFNSSTGRERLDSWQREWLSLAIDTAPRR